MTPSLIHSLTNNPQVDRVFSDASLLAAMLRFEIALAKVEARLGVIPASSAQAIERAAKVEQFDIPALAGETQQSATPAVPFVTQLTEQVRHQDAAFAGYVHWGATSQDVCDTAMVLLLQQVKAIFKADGDRLERSLVRMSNEHAQTVMLGRTLMQPATPITFGLKVAGWLGAIHRARKNVEQAFADANVLQFGGASGTLAALGGHGLKVAEALAQELELTMPEAPWHTQRDRLATLLTSCGVLVGTLAKMARDILLMSQPEVGEAREASSEGRGGSSTMPHKQNPVGCTLALAASNRTPGLIANFLSGMVQEHERGAGGWQAEWSTIADVISATGMALSSMASVAENLIVDATKMRANIEATQGRIFAERAMFLLSAKIGRDKAHYLVEAAARSSVKQNKRLKDCLAEMKEVQEQMNAEDLKSLEDPEAYIGSAEEFRRSTIAAIKKDQTEKHKG